MKKRLVYHIVAQPYWEVATEFTINKMKNDGLWDKFDEIHFCCHYDPDRFTEFARAMSQDSRVSFHVFKWSVHRRGETWTNNKLKELCDRDTEEWAVLRLHNKSSNYYDPNNVPPGSSYQGPTEGAFVWRDLVYYWNIERWPLMLQKLEEVEIVGNEWLPQYFAHAGGNVYWVRSSYIKRLGYMPRPKHFDHHTGYYIAWEHPRHEVESWIGSGNPSAWAAYPTLSSWAFQCWHEHDPQSPFTDRELTQ
jgi:hypothetical protein